jgi:hypothetical protein
MRALFITIALAVVAAAGFLVYRQSAPPTSTMETAASPTPVAPATAADCNILNAVYEYNSDRRLQLRFELIPQASELELDTIGGRQVGNLNFVVHVTSLNTDHKFKPDNNFLSQGPRWQTVATFLRPVAGGDRFQVSMFDRSMEYIDQLPRDTSTAPAHVYMPDMLRSLYRQHIDLPPGMFSYLRCEQPPAAAAP